MGESSNFQIPEPEIYIQILKLGEGLQNIINFKIRRSIVFRLNVNIS